MHYTEISFSTLPLLSFLQLLPLIAGLMFLALRLRGRKATFMVIGVAFVELLLALLLYAQFDQNLPGNQFQFAEHIPIWGVLEYHVGVDGISVLFIILTALLTFIGVLFVVMRNLHLGSLPASLLLVQATLMSQLTTLDFLWFWIMSLLEVMAIGYINLRWATTLDARTMITRFMQFMAVGLLLLGIGGAILAWLYADSSSTHVWSFNLLNLANLNIESHLATIIFFFLFYGFAIRVPLFPLHGWLPIFIEQGNIAVAPILFVGVKMGIYGLIRFVFPLVPEAVSEWQNFVVTIAVLGVFYAALLAIQQNNLRRLLAFAVVSHTSLLVIGLFSLNRVGFLGSIFLALNFGLAISGLLSITGIVWRRTNTFMLPKLGQMYRYIPMVGIAFLISSLAIIGMPGTPGFEGVHFLLEASVKQFGALITIVAAIGNVVAAGFLLRAFQQVFLKKATVPIDHWNCDPMRRTELVLASTVIVSMLVVGFFPEPWLELIDNASTEMANLYAQPFESATGDH